MICEALRELKVNAAIADAVRCTCGTSTTYSCCSKLLWVAMHENAAAVCCVLNPVLTLAVN